MLLRPQIFYISWAWNRNWLIIMLLFSVVWIVKCSHFICSIRMCTFICDLHVMLTMLLTGLKLCIQLLLYNQYMWSVNLMIYVQTHKLCTCIVYFLLKGYLIYIKVTECFKLNWPVLPHCKCLREEIEKQYLHQTGMIWNRC